ncbi:uncharacterized protein LDX57_009129 [Aspergillus melleus]|uniref:uncharacterized protein n=1 Tax=Aspergillus melleus TaxID=138277 RepID=UPI001E8D68EE|nr:uncharacterized protein LDX57_009129 [Aspergillus melleus]KAH8431466.1 hypothetical protein LDX57_009129 [Aspergillus melleus]
MHAPNAPELPKMPETFESSTSLESLYPHTSPKPRRKRGLLKEAKPWDQSFADHNETCLMRLKRAHHHVHHSIWKPTDGEGRPPVKKVDTWNASEWKTVYIIWDPIKANCWPPKNVRLSDNWVYLAVKLLPAEERASRYKADFDKDGNIRPSRVPCGNPPVVNAHGLYCLPVFKESYVLCGGELAAHGNWILGVMGERAVPFTLGLVCVPREAIPADGPNIERYLFYHDTPNQWDMEQPFLADWNAAEARWGTYDRWCLDNSDQRTMLYSLYPNAQPNYQLLPVSEINGFTVLCNSQHEPSSRLLPKPATPGQVTITDFFGTRNIWCSARGGDTMGGLSNQQFLNENHNAHILKNKLHSPSTFASKPLDIMKEEQPQWEESGLKTEADVPHASIPEVMNLALSAPTNVDGIRHILGWYSGYLQDNADLTLEDVEMQIGDLYAYVQHCREVEEMEEMEEMDGESDGMSSNQS